MKSILKMVWVLLAILSLQACSKDSGNNDQPEPIDFEDIVTTADIGPEGGLLQVIDESGNLVTVSFPAGAIMDTSSVTLTLHGKYMELPINTRNLRAFDISPSDISLYEPVDIKIEYESAINEIEHTALFFLESNTLLTPLMDHDYSGDKRLLSASTLKLGNFAEGRMTLEQLKTQFELLQESLGITWESTEKSTKLFRDFSSDGSQHKDIWDNCISYAGSILKILELLELDGYYENPPDGTTLEEDIKKICDKILRKGVEEVLEKDLPDNPCDRDYTHTLVCMMRDMNLYGCVQNDEFEGLDKRFNQMLRDCQSFLSISTEINIVQPAGGMTILSIGAVPLVITGSSGSGLTVEGYGTLQVSGNLEGAEQCTSSISGETVVELTGTRDAGYTYAFELYTEQNAMLTVICPKYRSDTPILASGSRNITLSKANNFTIHEVEQIDGGTFTMDLTLDNPYTVFPGTVR